MCRHDRFLMLSIFQMNKKKYHKQFILSQIGRNACDSNCFFVEQLKDFSFLISDYIRFYGKRRFMILCEEINSIVSSFWQQNALYATTIRTKQDIFLQKDPQSSLSQSSGALQTMRKIAFIMFLNCAKLSYKYIILFYILQISNEIVLKQNKFIFFFISQCE